jgi:hypothetical protein
MGQQQRDSSAQAVTIDHGDRDLGKGSDNLRHMIGTWLGAPVRASVTAAFRRKLRQIAARAVGDITGAGCQHHRDGVIVSQFFEGAQHFANRGAAQSVSFFRPVNRDFRDGAALLDKNVLSLSVSMNKSFLLSSNASKRITLRIYPCQSQFFDIFFFFFLSLDGRARGEGALTRSHMSSGKAMCSEDRRLRFEIFKTI